MARKNTNAELFSHVTQFGYLADKSTGAATFITTLATTAPAAGTSLTVAAASTIQATTGNLGYVGDAGNVEMFKLEAISTADVLTLVSGLAYDHSTGEAVKELTRTNMGDISDDGVQVEVSADRNAINVATERHTYHHHIAHTDYQVTVQLENLSDENLYVMMGIPEATAGLGTAADPHVIDWMPDEIDTIDPLFFYMTGVLKGGDLVEIQFMDCRLDPTKTITFARGQDAPAQIVFNTRLHRFMTWTPA